MIRFSHKGDFSKVTRFLERAKEVVHLGDLDKYGREGVAALASATPVDSGLTASSWYYEIVNRNGSAKITFYNSNIQNGKVNGTRHFSENKKKPMRKFLIMYDA